MAFGLVMATLYSAYAVILFALSGPEPFASRETSIKAVIVMYYTAGAMGGLVVGAMSRLSRWWLGTMLLGTAAGLIVIFLGSVTLYGPFWHWTADIWENTALLGVAFGIVGGIVWRRVIVG